MAHLFSTGLFFGQQAWHGLGTVLPAESEARFSSSESIRLAGLDWEVETQPLYLGDGSKANGHNAVVRKDTGKIMGVVGDRYECLQNSHQFDWFSPFLETKEVAFETCGALKEGQLVWVLAKVLRDDAEVAKGDKIRKYLLLTSSHDGSTATSVGFCPIRVVCWNTLSAGLNNSASKLIKVRHTQRQKDALTQIRETINLVDETFEATAKQYRRLMECPITPKDLRRYVKLVLEYPEEEIALSTRKQNILENVINLCVNGVGNDGKTAWSAYNGITHYTTHVYGRTPDSRLTSNWYGHGKTLSNRAFELALQLAS